MKIRKIEIGQVFKNWNNNHHIIQGISKTGSVLTCKNLNTRNVIKFKWQNASGKYISGDTLELGEYYGVLVALPEYDDKTLY